MTNFEKYKDEILILAKNNRGFAFRMNKITGCNSPGCENCIFKGACIANRIKWLYEEYQEPAPKLTKAERGFCEIVKTGYIARNSDGSLYTYKEFPSKNDFEWVNIIGRRRIKTSSYPFITWESGKAWSIEDLLELEVEE